MSEDVSVQTGSHAPFSVKLDTSGYVVSEIGPAYPSRRWTDLSPFEQGYVEAMFASAVLIWESTGSPAHTVQPAFWRLAPETLAVILRDCEDARHMWRGAEGAEAGRKLWEGRQAGVWANFPPLVPTLTDDGKVRFR